MLRIEYPGHLNDPAETIQDGVLARISSPKGLAQLLELAIARKRTSSPVVKRPSETEDEAQLRDFTASLLVLPDFTDEKIKLEPASMLTDSVATGLVRDVHKGEELGLFASLIVALSGALEAWIGGTRAPDEESIPDPSIGKVGLPDDQPLLEALLLLPMPGAQREATLSFPAPRAVLDIRPGSVVIGLGIIGALRAKWWTLGLVTRATSLVRRAPRAAARNFVDQMRARTDWGRSFPRLDRLRRNERDHLRQSQLIVVLVHGLFATDRGTFDRLIERLERKSPVALNNRLLNEGHTLTEGADGSADPREQFDALERMARDLQLTTNAVEDIPRDRIKLKAKNATGEGLQRAADAIPGAFAQWRNRSVRELSEKTIGIVGFPHFTLDAIEHNGAELADRLRDLLEDCSARIAFVCHSRGGLVARWAAARLRELPEWRDRVTDLITFGTPHEGAELAEHMRAADFGAYLLAVNATHTAASLSDVLAYLQEYRTEGIFDLRPGGGATAERQTMFITRLFEEEYRVGRPPITAVGGALDAAALSAWRQRMLSAFVAWKTGQGEHDMVVTIRSSLAERFTPDLRLVARCDHFSYFKPPPGRHDLLLDAVAAKIWSRVDVARALREWRELREPNARPMTLKEALQAEQPLAE